jgi:hypothetical protein
MMLRYKSQENYRTFSIFFVIQAETSFSWLISPLGLNYLNENFTKKVDNGYLETRSLIGIDFSEI